METGYNGDASVCGYVNWETFNVAVWISNDEFLYWLAFESQGPHPYKQFVDALTGENVTETPDRVDYDDPDLDIEALDAMLQEMHDDDADAPDTFRIS